MEQAATKASNNAGPNIVNGQVINHLSAKLLALSGKVLSGES